jgi:hypothetical protein
VVVGADSRGPATDEVVEIQGFLPRVEYLAVWETAGKDSASRDATQSAATTAAAEERRTLLNKVPVVYEE